MTNIDIIEHARSIPFFRGVYMRDELPKHPFSKECGIINLDSSKNSGSHWVAYIKCNNNVIYFDSYGNLKPPTEFIAYVGTKNIKYNNENIQQNHPYNCGHLCIQFLRNFWSKKMSDK